MDLEFRKVLNSKVQVWESFVHYKMVSTVFEAVC